MIILDTNVLVASIFENHPHHPRAETIIENLRGSKEKQCITYGVLVELSQVMHRFRSAAFAAVQVADAIKTFEILSPNDLAQVSEVYLAHCSKLSFVDCEILVISREIGAELITFDEKLQKALAP